MADYEVYDDEEIVTLEGPDGEKIDFYEVADIEYQEKEYVILAPVEELPGIEEDEALLFSCKPDGEGNFDFTIELDDETIDAVFAIYNERLDALEAEEQ